MCSIPLTPLPPTAMDRVPLLSMGIFSMWLVEMAWKKYLVGIFSVLGFFLASSHHPEWSYETAIWYTDLVVVLGVSFTVLYFLAPLRVSYSQKRWFLVRLGRVITIFLLCPSHISPFKFSCELWDWNLSCRFRSGRWWTFCNLSPQPLSHLQNGKK